MKDRETQLELIRDVKLRDPSFIHLFRHFMESGKLSSLSGNALKIYLCIKFDSSFKDGISKVPWPKLMDRTGIKSRNTLGKGLKELEEENLLLVKKRKGKENQYLILDDFEAVGEGNNPVVNITLPYVRGDMNKMIKGIPGMITSKLIGHELKENVTINFNFINQDNRVQNFYSTTEKETIDNEQDLEFDFDAIFRK